ncbi:MAG: ATP-dependent helicase HrpB [Lentisphaeria bacterium]|nr:ATP-dependent helicase HrpB [Lentisphaeria bacterium]
MKTNSPPLPIETRLLEISEYLQQNDCLVLTADTGAGKSTWLPLALLDYLTKPGKILLVVPRRVTVRAITRRLSWYLDEHPGATVGWRTRLDSKISDRTQIEVVTDGIFLNLVQESPELSDYALIILDEYHERSLFMDLGLTFLNEAREVFCEHIQLLVMSATLDAPRLQRFLGDVPHIHIEGKMFPVDIQYSKPSGQGWALLEHAASETIRLLNSVTGDVLIFLPGQREIFQLERLLNTKLTDGFQLRLLYGGQREDEQDQALAPSKGEFRKVILSTPIAETSLTIEGLGGVIDLGLERYPVFSFASNSHSLQTRRISQSSAIQRSGRAGRLAPGKCLRLLTEDEFLRMDLSVEPAIVRQDPIQACIQIARWGATSFEALDWLDAPNPKLMQVAASYLNELHILDSDGGLTALGKRVIGYGVAPYHAILLDASIETDALDQVTAIVAILEMGDFWNGNDVDVRIRIDALIAGVGGRSKGVRPAMLQQTRSFYKRLYKRFICQKKVTEQGLWKTLLTANMQLLAKQRGAQLGLYLTAGGLEVRLADSDPLIGQTYLIVLQVGGQSNNLRIFLALPVQESKLVTFLREYSVEKILAKSDGSNLKFIKQKCIGQLILSESPAFEVSKEDYRIAYCNYAETLPKVQEYWEECIQRLQIKEQLLDKYLPEEKELIVALHEARISNFSGTILSHLQGKFSTDQILQINWADVLTQKFDWRLQQLLKELLPDQIQFSKGKPAKISYLIETDAEVSIRLQWMFNQKHPTILKGRLPLKLHLLSPAQRTIQTTRDLANFWKENYQYVRKDMKGRYPKHDWPENPS